MMLDIVICNDIRDTNISVCDEVLRTRRCPISYELSMQFVMIFDNDIR